MLAVAIIGAPSARAAIKPAADIPAPVTAGATPASDGATVAGWVQINDDVSADPVVSCTGSTTATQRGGITRFDVIPGITAAGTATNTVLAQNKIPGAAPSGFTSGARPITYANAYWNTFGRDRGYYTIKPTYHARIPSLPCAKGTTSTAGVTGPAGPSCPDANLVSYVTTIIPIINTDLATTQCAPLNALGTATAGAPITVLVDNRTELALTPSADQNSQMGQPTSFTATATLRSAHANLGSTSKPALPGKTVVFAVDGPGGYTLPAVTTNSSGAASAVITTNGLAAGIHHLTATFAQDSAWRGSVSNQVIVKLADNTAKPELTLPASVLWDDSFEVSATVRGTGGGIPGSGTMRFTFGPETVNVPLVDGRAVHTFRATSNPGAYQVTATYSGDEIFNASPTATKSIDILARPTTIVYDGPPSARWGDNITLGATLRDATTLNPLPGKLVTFVIGTQTLSATTDASGRATASLPATSDVGDYNVTAVYVPTTDPRYLGSSATKAITIDFRHWFSTSTVKVGLNPATRQFNYKPAGGRATGIVKTPGMFSVFLPTDVNYQGLPALPTVPYQQVADNATSTPGGTPFVLPPLPPLPTTPAFPAAQTQSTATAENTASNPVPVGGFTLGELVTRLASGDYPTDITACEVLTASACERRLTVLVHQQPGFVLVGVFDLKNGNFSTFKVDAGGALSFSAFDALKVPVPDIPVVTPPGCLTPPILGATATMVCSPAPGTLGEFLLKQMIAVGAAAGMTPDMIATQVLSLSVPTPEGGVQQVTTTVQEAIDRFGGTVLFDSANTGIAQTPEINAGSIMHTATFSRSYGLKSVPKGSPRPFASKSEAEAVLPKYTVTTSGYVPTTPLVPGINPAILVPTGTVPVAVPEGLVPPGAKNPLLATHWGGPLINVQGGGWNQSGPDPARGITSQSGTGAHTGGDSLLGTSLDTAPRTTNGLSDPWPIYIPLYTANSALQDSSIDFLGFGLPISVATCIDLGSFTIGNTTTYLPMTCISVNVLLGDGVSVFSAKAPVNFRTDLALIWAKPAPPVAVASAAIAGAVALLPSATSLLGLVPAVPSTSNPLSGVAPTTTSLSTTTDPFTSLLI